MNIKLLNTINKDKIKIGDAIISDDGILYIVCKNCNETYGLFNPQTGNQLFQFDKMQNMIQYCKDMNQIKRVIPGNKLTLIEEQ